MSERKIRESVRKNVAFKQEYKCAICNIMLPPSYQIDHIVPFSLTSDNREQNLQALCATCHANKSQQEYYRIIKYKKIKSNYENYNKDICWFCLKDFDKKTKHSCDKKIIDIDEYELCNKLEDLNIRENKHLDNILDIIIYDNQVFCKDNYYDIDNKNFTIQKLADIIFHSTRTKKDSKKYDEIIIKLKFTNFITDNSSIEKLNEYINDQLPLFINERIIKDDFIIIHIE